MTLKFYEENAERFIADSAHIDMRAYYESFTKFVPAGGSILDAGSGSGRDSLAFAEMGFKVTAFDASRKMVDATRQRAKVPVVLMSFEDLAFDEMFDGIWACASLLHMPRARLAEVFIRFSNILRSSGVIYASFKYGRNEREEAGRFFCDFDEQLLSKCVDNVPSLDVVNLWVTIDQRPQRNDQKWLNCLLKKTPH